MRVLMWFTIGFAASCAIGAYFDAFLWVAVVAFALAIVLLFLKHDLAKRAAVVLLGLAIGMGLTLGYHALYLNSAKNHDGKNTYTTAVVSDYSYETDYGVAADGKVTLNGKKYNVRIYLNNTVPLKPGDRIEGDIRFRLTTKSAKKGQTHHQGDGIFLLGYVEEKANVIYADEVPLRYFPAQLRHEIQDVIEDAFPEDVYAFANALFLGESSQLDYEIDTDFKLSGIRHIIAVSGLHVSILLSIVFMLFGRNRYLSAIIGVPLLLLFAAVVGFTPSVVRACIMQALMLIGIFFNKEYDPPTSLSFAALTMLLVNPLTIVSVSFQLSIGCIIGIFLFFERVNGYLLQLLRAPKGKGLRARITRWFAASVSITLSTFVTTTPLSAMYFGTISIVGVLTNLLTLWVVSFIFCGIIVVILASLIWFPLAEGIAWIIAFPIRYVIFVAKLLANLPVSAVYTNSVYIVIWLVACYCLFAAFIIFKKKYPMVMSGCAVCLLAVAIAASWLEPRLDHYRITVFDVGQGQSILFQYEDQRYLVDCGGDSNRVAADTVSHHLLSAGITHLDGLIVTHYDNDHAGGVPNLLTSISVDRLYLPDVEDDSGMKEILATSGETIEWVSGLKRMEFPGIGFTMVPGEHKTNDNERSMCILFQIEDCDILITGDRSAVGERALLNDMNLPEIDVLVVGHHGSASSTSMELLEKVKPKTAVISVSGGNYYGHPTADVLYRLRLFECAVWRTDMDGTIVFRG